MMIVAGGLSAVANDATALTANEVMNNMKDGERFAYVSGIVDGLAYARWLRDQPDSTGTKCIYGWYYSGQEENRILVLDWFERHPDKHADQLMYVLIKKECGE